MPPASRAVITVCCITLTALSGCSDRELRGRSVDSPDGGTYLVVDDDNGGRCGPLRIDGRDWPHEIGEPGPIAPGAHEITCGGDGTGISFAVRSGTTFHSDYWGP